VDPAILYHGQDAPAPAFPPRFAERPEPVPPPWRSSPPPVERTMAVGLAVSCGRLHGDIRRRQANGSTASRWRPMARGAADPPFHMGMASKPAPEGARPNSVLPLLSFFAGEMSSLDLSKNSMALRRLSSKDTKAGRVKARAKARHGSRFP
jgi:hypothetical protein